MTVFVTVCSRAALILAVLGLSVATAQQVPSEVLIGTVDFFGLRKLSVDTLRPALTVKEGDPLSLGKCSSSFDESEKRLAAIPGVLQARVNTVFTDRNKASAALAQLTRNGDPELLALLRRDAMIPLIEMARWNDNGHALFAFSIVARMAGYSDNDALKHFFNNDRETVIAAALN